MWHLNPGAQENFSSLGLSAVLLLTIVSLFCATAAIGLRRGSRWGHWLSIGLIATNLIGDITNVLLGTEPRAIVGIPIAGAILLYLLVKKSEAPSDERVIWNKTFRFPVCGCKTRQLVLLIKNMPMS